MTGTGDPHEAVKGHSSIFFTPTITNQFSLSCFERRSITHTHSHAQAFAHTHTHISPLLSVLHDVFYT